MAASGYTPISLYYSSTASATPTAGNLVNGELAINITDGKLYYKDNGGVVQLLASKAGASGDVVGPASATDNAVARFDLTTGKLIQNSVVTIGDTGDVAGVGALSMSGAVTLSGGTANGVAYLNGSKVLTTGSALVFDGTNLGLGNTTPANPISIASVSDPIVASRFSSSINGPFIFFQKSRSGTVGTQTIVQNGDSLGGIVFEGSDGSGFVRGALIGAYVDGTPGANDMPGRLVFSTTADGAANPTERMRIDSSGNLGLGVTPSAWNSSYKAIELSGAAVSTLGGGQANLSNNVYVGSGGQWISKAGGAASLYQQNSGTHVWYQASSSTAGNAISFTQAMTLDASGNLGIGLSTPVAYSNYKTISAQGATTTAGGVFQTQNSDASLQAFFYTASGEGRLGTVTNHPQVFVTNNTERMRIDSSGNVGIGTSSPSAALSVKEKLLFSNPSGNTGLINNGVATGDVRLFGGSSGTNGAGVILYGGSHGATPDTTLFMTGSTERMRIDSNGNLLVGTTSYFQSIVTSSGNNATGVSNYDAQNTNSGNNSTKFARYSFSGVDTVGTKKPTAFIDCGPESANYVSSYLSFSTRNADAVGERVRIDGLGRLMVGYSSATTSTVCVETPVVSIGRTGDTNTTTRLRFAPQQIGYNVFGIWNNNTSSGGGLIFGTGDNSTNSSNTAMMTLDAAGSLCVGALASDGYKVVLQGAAGTSGSNVGNFVFVTDGRNGSSATDGGRIYFGRVAGTSGLSDAAGYIGSFTANSSAALQGGLSFGVNSSSSAGSVPSEVMRLNIGGQLTLAYQPAFMAFVTTGTYTSGTFPGTLISSTVPTQRSSGYSGGTFTAPVSGLYQFNFEIYDFNATVFAIAVYRNGTIYVTPGGDVYQYVTAAKNMNNWSFTMYLSASDYLQMGIRGTTSISVYGGHSVWSGYLVG